MAFGSTPVFQTVFQSPSGGGTGSSNANGGSAGDTTGADLLFAKLGFGFLAGISISDNFGNTGWTGLTVYGNTSEDGGLSQIWYCENAITGPGHIITITCGSGDAFFTCIFEAWGGALSSGSFDVETGAASESAPVDTGSKTPSQSGSLIVSVYAPRNNSFTPTINSGWATPVGMLLNQVGNAYAGYGSYQVQTSAASVHAVWNDDDTNDHKSAGLAIFKPSGGGGGATVKRLSALGVG